MSVRMKVNFTNASCLNEIGHVAEPGQGGIQPYTGVPCTRSDEMIDFSSRYRLPRLPGSPRPPISKEGDERRGTWDAQGGIGDTI